MITRGQLGVNMPDYALSAAQVAQYEEEGFLLLPDFFPRQDMDQMLAIARADQALQDNANDRLDGAGKVSRLSLRYDLPARVYSAYARHRAIVEPMEQPIGDEVFHYHHKMMLKEPRVGGAWRMASGLRLLGTPTSARRYGFVHDRRRPCES